MIKGSVRIKLTSSNRVLHLRHVDNPLDEGEKAFDESSTHLMTALLHDWCLHGDELVRLLVGISRSINDKRLILAALVDLVLKMSIILFKINSHSPQAYRRTCSCL